MAKIPWVFKNDTTGATFTTSVLSANYMYLRQSYKDYFAGAPLTITIKNQANEAAGFTLNDRVDLYYMDGVTKVWNQKYWVDEIQFTDYPGNVGLSTATITCIDWLARAARVLGGGYVIGSQTTCQQVGRLAYASGGPLPSDMSVGVAVGASNGAAYTVDDSCVNFIQISQITENGSCAMFGQTFQLNPRTALVMATHAEFGRTPSASVLGYQTFDRIRAGQSMINDVEVTYGAGVTTSYTNNLSANVYGKYSENVTSNNVGAVTAQRLAQMRALYQGEPTSQRYVFSFDDLSNDSTLMATWLNLYKTQGAFTYDMNYLVPGASVETTELIRLEGVHIDLTPERTTFTVYASPFAYYDMFVLGTPMGVLGQDYLGW